ncbi:MAG: diguanylate cyclase [Xanthomonadales bacterium]|nr:diguanylate cyclase [Xanthomonadales bacterium]
MVRQAEWKSGHVVTICALAFLLLLLITPAFGQANVPGSPTEDEVREILDRAREISYTKHWRDAQAILDELAPHIEQMSRPAFVDFHLLEARHLALADRQREGLDRAAMLLELDLEPDERLRVLQFSANVAVLLRDYETAFEHLIAAIELGELVEDPAVTMSTYNMASYMFGKVGELERAMAYGRTAIDIALDHGEPNDECVARQRIAPVYKWAGRFERSEAEYREAIDVCGKINNELFQGVVQHGLADLLRQQGRLEEARELAESAIVLLENAVYPLGEFEARLVLAQILVDLGEQPTFQQHTLADLAGYFRENEFWDQLTTLEALRARLAINAGNREAALRHLALQEEARENFLSRDRLMRLAYLEVVFDTRLKEQQIALLEERARVSQLEADTANRQRRDRTTILVLSGFVVILLAILLLVTLRGRRHFRSLSRRDHLSGLPNQRWFAERAGLILDRARRERLGVYFVMADIDHFKAINDSYGHLTGDEVLGQVARRLKDAFDDRAFLGRVGGEEFAILMETDDIGEVIRGIDRFRQSPERVTRAGDPDVTLSFGIAPMHPGDTVDRLRQRADRALYRAKQEGRDRYVVSDDPGS